MKKLLVTLFALIFTVSFVSTSFSKNGHAQEQNVNDYQTLQQEGILDNSISEKQWNQHLQESKAGEQAIENEPDGTSTRSKFHLKSGDILISNATSSKGLTGHAAIAISGNKVLHIHSAGHHPAVHSLSWLKKRYAKKGKWLKIYRSKNSKAGAKAASWAKKNYVGKKYKYGINMKLKSKNPTYCSKIIYQAYKYGASKKSIYDPGSHIIAPYALPNIFSKSYKIRKVKTY
ncbi:YiiX/YebB-like N1pC/P60 family cysteine hydrolase [Streptococcus pneumoniae]